MGSGRSREDDTKVHGNFARTEFEKRLSTMKKASEVCGKPWCEKDARDVLQEDSFSSTDETDNDENRKGGQNLLDGDVLLRDLRDDVGMVEVKGKEKVIDDGKKYGGDVV